MAAADGTFDQPTEGLTTTISVTSWTPGDHTLLVRARDVAGNWGPNSTVTVTVGTATGSVALLGDQAVEAQLDNNVPGTAQAFQYVASASGTVTRLYVYVDASNTATSVIVGLYNTSGNDPGALLTQGTIANPVSGAWNSVSVPGANVSSGTAYWIAVLASSGTLQFRDVANGGPSQTSAQTDLTGLPTTWAPGPTWLVAPMSAYAATQ
jgi:hypothetical protein